EISPVLDRPVADAAPGVQAIGLRESAGRAGVQAAGAAAAEIGERRVGGQVERRQDLAEQEPGAAFRVEQHRVLAHRSEAGARGDLALEERTGIDRETGSGAGEGRLDAVAQRAEPPAHEIVVVGAARVAGDARPEVALRLLLARERRVLEGDAESAPGAFEPPRGIEPDLEPMRHPGHPRLVPALEPAHERPAVLERPQARDPGAGETRFESPGLELAGEVERRHGADPLGSAGRGTAATPRRAQASISPGPSAPGSEQKTVCRRPNGGLRPRREPPAFARRAASSAAGPQWTVGLAQDAVATRWTAQGSRTSAAPVISPQARNARSAGSCDGRPTTAISRFAGRARRAVTAEDAASSSAAGTTRRSPGSEPAATAIDPARSGTSPSSAARSGRSIAGRSRPGAKPGGATNASAPAAARVCARPLSPARIARGT